MAAVTIGWLGFVGGCASPELARPDPAKSISTSIAKPTALTEEAASALTAAEQSVIEARVKRSLWTAAVEHLKQARAAAQEFDSTATLAHAKEVVALCALSIQQLTLPPVKW